MAEANGLVEEDISRSLRVDRDHQSLTRKVGDGLRRAILSGQFEAGQRLVERMLCDMTGVSRTAIREALRSLEAEGLVVNIPNRGPTVASITLREAQDIYAVRELLELKAIELFMETMSEHDLLGLEKIVTDMERAYQEGNFDAVNDRKREFYDVVVKGSRNQIVARMLDQLYAKIAVLRHMTMSQTNRTAAAISEIRAIYDAMRSRSVKAAKRACSKHIEAAAAVALAALSRRERERD